MVMIPYIKYTDSITIKSNVRRQKESLLQCHRLEYDYNNEQRLMLQQQNDSFLECNLIRRWATFDVAMWRQLLVHFCVTKIATTIILWKTLEGTLERVNDGLLLGWEGCSMDRIYEKVIQSNKIHFNSAIY